VCFLDELGPHHKFSPVVKLGIRHPRKNERINGCQSEGASEGLPRELQLPHPCDTHYLFEIKILLSKKERHLYLNLTYTLHLLTPTYIYVYIYVYMYIYIYTYICLYVHIHLCVFKYVSVHIHLHTYTHSFIYIYKQICTYTHVQTNQNCMFHISIRCIFRSFPLSSS